MRACRTTAAGRGTAFGHGTAMAICPAGPAQCERDHWVYDHVSPYAARGARPHSCVTLWARRDHPNGPYGFIASVPRARALIRVKLYVWPDVAHPMVLAAHPAALGRAGRVALARTVTPPARAHTQQPARVHSATPCHAYPTCEPRCRPPRWRG